MNVLVVAAHPDDEVLGCGGTIASHVARGDTVNILIIGEGETSRQSHNPNNVSELNKAAKAAANFLGAKPPIMLGYPDNKLDSSPLLEIVQCIESYVYELAPEFVYTHHSSDLNNDHKIVHQATVTACRPIPGLPVSRLLMYEVLSSTDWGSMFFSPTFSPNFFVDIEAKMEAKLGAFDFYETEKREFPHPRSSEALWALAKTRGTSCGLKAAEAFEVCFDIFR